MQLYKERIKGKGSQYRMYDNRLGSKLYTVNNKEITQYFNPLGFRPYKAKVSNSTLEVIQCDKYKLGNRMGKEDLYNGEEMKYKDKDNTERSPAIPNTVTAINSSLNHIIPYNVLKEVWNTMIEYFPSEWAKIARAAVEAQFNLEGQDYSKIKDKMWTARGRSLHRGEMGTVIDDMSKGRQYDDTQDYKQDFVAKAFTWMPGNLTAGASDQVRVARGEAVADDAFDVEAAKMHYATLKKRDYVKKDTVYRQLYEKMKQFNEKSSVEEKNTPRDRSRFINKYNKEVREITEGIKNLLCNGGRIGRDADYTKVSKVGVD